MSIPVPTGDALIDALRATLGRLDRRHAAAVRLLLDHDHGVWLHDPEFVRRAVVQPDDGAAVRIPIGALQGLAADVRADQPWTGRNGAAAHAVLWLACDMVGGSLAAAGFAADSSTRSLILAALTEFISPTASTIPGVTSETGGDATAGNDAAPAVG